MSRVFRRAPFSSSVAHESRNRCAASPAIARSDWTAHAGGCSVGGTPYALLGTRFSGVPCTSGVAEQEEGEDAIRMRLARAECTTRSDVMKLGNRTPGSVAQAASSSACGGDLSDVPEREVTFDHRSPSFDDVVLVRSSILLDRAAESRDLTLGPLGSRYHDTHPALAHKVRSELRKRMRHLWNERGLLVDVGRERALRNARRLGQRRQKSLGCVRPTHGETVGGCPAHRLRLVRKQL